MTSLKKALSNSLYMATLFLPVILFLFEEFLFDFPQVRLFQQVLLFRPADEIRIAIASGIGSLAICYLFIWSALTGARAFQVFYIFLFGLSTLVQYGFWKAVGRFLSPADLQIAAATPLNTWQGAGAIYFDWRFILPVTGFILSILFFNQRRSLKSSFLNLGYLILLIVALNFSYTFTNKKPDLGISVSAFYQTIARYGIDSLHPPVRETIKSQSFNTPQNNIVLVIDESIRGDHLAINGYPRPTTPFLSDFARTDDFHSFGLAVAGATCSYSSNALILTGVRPGIDSFSLVQNYPTAFQYAKAVGYKTYYMDAQTNSLWNGLTDRDLAYIDSWYKAVDLGDDKTSDFRAAEIIVDIVREGTGNFIVLNKRGVHFLYESSYEVEQATWLPVPESYTNQPDLVANSYDNGILYNVNTFFEILLADPRILETTTILYTSDHGQTLFENQVSWLHCNYTPQEATVPLVLIGKGLPVLDENSSVTHSNLLPTLLDLMNVPPDQRTHPYALSLFDVTKAMVIDRFFFDGSLRLIDFPDE